MSARCWHCERLGVTHDVGDASPPFIAIDSSRRRHQDDRSSDAEPPQVPAREASSDEVPRGAAGIAKHARAHGWTVREVYSRSAAGVEAVSARARRQGAVAVAYYRDGKFAWGLSADASDGVRKVGARELRAFLAEVSSDGSAVD